MSTPRIAILAIVCLVLLGVYWLKAPVQNAPQGGAMVDVTIPDLSSEHLKGKVLFDDNCASCHGKNAAGQQGVAPPLIPKIYEPNHHADISFQLAAKNGVRAHHWPFGNMPPVPTVKQSDVMQIVQYVRAVQRANGIN